KPPEPATRCARAAEPARSVTEPLVPPLQMSVVYRIDGLDQIEALNSGDATGFIYARDGHPNAVELARQLAELERAETGLVCGSGMAAEAAVLLALLESGSHAALSEGLYGKTVALAARELARFGVKCSFFDATRPESLREVLRPETRVVF